ncbi:MAG: 1-acyl-sn-glycerol-3-phosphate acyltransferase [Deltaproteobacteria bacterium]|nr:1-acyl-sn-glycerol-3-phosphate acyltransferase [Deltaproteobacteria bacterium]
MAPPLPLRRPVDAFVTLAVWIYFLGGIVLLPPAYLVALVSGRPRAAIQRVHHWYLRGFFALALMLAPGLRRRVDPTIRGIRGSIVVCNHRSYLDPLLLVTLLPRHTTFVKPVFFRVPVFGWALAAAGYLPAGGEVDRRLLRRMDRLRRHLESGGNVFVFPEGRRARGADVGPFRAGAFRLARRFGAPIELLRVDGTDRLFEPGRFLFHTCVPNVLSVERLGRVELPGPDEPLGPWVEDVRRRYLPSP